MALMHIKLQNGEDLIGHGKVMEEGKKVKIKDAITVKLNYEYGLEAKSWMMFSKEDSVVLPAHHVLFISNANQEAMEYYQEFMHDKQQRQANHSMNEVPDSDSELEELYNTILESRNSTKH